MSSEGPGGGNVKLLIWGPRGGGHGVSLLVPALPTEMTGIHFDCGAAGFKAVSLCHYTVIMGAGKERLSCLPLPGWLFFPSKEASLDKRLEHPRSSSLGPCLWGNPLVQKTQEPVQLPPSSLTQMPRKGRLPTPCRLVHGLAAGLPGGRGWRPSTYTLPYSISVMVMVLTCQTSSLLGMNRSSLARWPTQREAMSPK